MFRIKNSGRHDASVFLPGVLFWLLFLVAFFSPWTTWATPTGQTVVVSAEGLADPAAEKYRGDKELLVDALRQDARRQAIEKAVGSYVDSSTLVENYQLINDRVLTKSSGLIKQIIKESAPWKGDDGLMHLLLKAEVYIADVKDALKDMSRDQRVNLIKESGNPRIAVEIFGRDAERGKPSTAERSQVAENILKERFSRFGYRVWSRGSAVEEKKAGGVDFLVQGEAKFKKITATLKASGVVVSKYALTSWTVKCKELQTGEEIFFTNKIPLKTTWADEDAALEDIGRMVADEFNEGFFEFHLMRPSKTYQLRVDGLPDYDSGLKLKAALIGLRNILNVDFRSFTAAGGSHFEIDFAGRGENLAQIVNNGVVAPLNRKLGQNLFKLVAASGNSMQIKFATIAAAEIKKRMDTSLPAGIAEASPQRIGEMVHDPALMKKVAAINPDAVNKLASQGNQVAKEALGR